MTVNCQLRLENDFKFLLQAYQISTLQIYSSVTVHTRLKKLKDIILKWQSKFFEYMN